VMVEETDEEGNDVPPVAEEIQAAVVTRLRAAVINLMEQRDAGTVELAKNTEIRLAHARDRLKRLLEKRRAMSAAAGRVDLDRESILEELRMLEAQRRDLEIERVGQKARREAIERRIALVSAMAKDSTSSDEVSAQLRQIVELRAEQLARLEALHEKRRIPEFELEAGKEPLFEAQAQLALRRQEVAEQSGGETIAHLNRELSELSIDSSEMEARAQYLDTQIKRLTPVLEIAERLEFEVHLAMPAAQEAVKNEMDSLEALRTRLATIKPPRLDVLDSELGAGKGHKSDKTR